MLYMIQLTYAPEKADALRRYFEQRGVTGHSEGVVMLGAWVTKTRHAYALLEVREQRNVDHVSAAWSEFGNVSYEPVIDINQIM